MSSDPADFKYPMICEVPSVTFLYFHPSASFFSSHLDFINGTPSDFLSQNKIFLKHTIFLKKVKNQNKQCCLCGFMFFSFVCHWFSLPSYQ